LARKTECNKIQVENSWVYMVFNAERNFERALCALERLLCSANQMD